MNSFDPWLRRWEEPRSSAERVLKGLWVFGLGLVLAGVVLVLFPQLLAWLLAVVLSVTGFGLIGVAWLVRRWLRRWEREEDREWLI